MTAKEMLVNEISKIEARTEKIHKQCIRGLESFRRYNEYLEYLEELRNKLQALEEEQH